MCGALCHTTRSSLSQFFYVELSRSEKNLPKEILHVLCPLALPDRVVLIDSAGRRDRGVAQPGSAPALGAGGRPFKSARPDSKKETKGEGCPTHVVCAQILFCPERQ